MTFNRLALEAAMIKPPTASVESFFRHPRALKLEETLCDALWSIN